MALKSSHHLRPIVSTQSSAHEAIIRDMRATLADMRETTNRTVTLIEATRDALAAAEDLLAQSISRAPRRR